MNLGSCQRREDVLGQKYRLNLACDRQQRFGDIELVSKNFTFERLQDGAAVEDESGDLLEVEEEAGDDVEDVDQAQAEHQAPPGGKD